MTMVCADGVGYQCSGSSIIRIDNSIALTSSGVEAYGVSTSDLAAKNPTMTGAFGLAPATGGTAEVRLAKGSDGTVSSSAVLLSKLGLSWDGKTERPPIIDTFSTTQGRTVLTASGALSSTALPASSDLSFYDYASKSTAGTQTNYANNRYFPRSAPSRCPPDLVPCPTTETSGVHYSPGDWRTGGSMPDLASVSRVHEDGDIHAGNGLPDANGNPTILPGGDGIGVPFPGSKGYRSLDNWGLQYANLAAWLTQDTVIIEEWAKAGNEHNKNRRGMVAYGDVTNPTAVPTSGTASYSGFAYGWYTPNGTADPAVFRGTVVVSVNFTTRQTTVTIQNPVTWDSAATSVPVALTTTVPMGAAGSNVANYLTGPVTNGALTGGVGGRYFGPVLTTGTSGAGPAEIGGTITLSNATSGQMVLGGFIARKQ